MTLAHYKPWILLAALALVAPLPGSFAYGQHAGPDKQAADSALAAKQAKLAEQYKDLERVILRMADVMQSNDPKRAALLKKVFSQSRERQIDVQLEQLVKLLQKEQLYQATKEQATIQQELDQLLELLLSGQREKQITSERAAIKRYIERINKIIRDEQGLQGETEGAGDEADLARRQDKVAEKTAELAKELEEFDARHKPAGQDASGDGKVKDSKGGDDKDGKPDPFDNKNKGDSKSEKDGDSKSKRDGAQEGKSEGDKDSKSEGDKDSKSDGKNEGESKGDAKDKSKGDSKSENEGDSKSKREGKSEKDSEGNQESKSKGDSKSESKGDSKQKSKGDSQSESQGDSENESQGDSQSQQESDESPARQRIRQAEERMREAKRRLEEAQRRGAAEEQQKAIDALQEAKAELEEILRQLREEEIERVLAMLEGRFRKMLQMQIEVYEGTMRLDRIAEADRDRDVEIEASKLSRKEAEISAEADKTLNLLREEGSSVAFPESVDMMRDDMDQVTQRLSRTNVGEITQGIQQDIIKALEEMIAALQKAQKEQQDRAGQQQPGQGGGGGGQDQPLVDMIAELKMIRALQMRVNKGTQRYSRMLKEGVERAEEPELLDAVKRLGEREERIYRTTRDIVVGKNK